MRYTSFPIFFSNVSYKFIIQGPVRVSEAMSASTRTLDGIEDPIVDHILWKKRFLWDMSDPSTKNNNVYSFYVNEMMNQASKTPPTRLCQAVGGILAGMIIYVYIVLLPVLEIM